MSSVAFSSDLPSAQAFLKWHIRPPSSYVETDVLNAFQDVPKLRLGTVLMYNPQLHTAKVAVKGDVMPWACMFSDEYLSYDYGFSLTAPPKEGEGVLLYELGPNTSTGLIVGRVPYYLCYAEGSSYNDPDHLHRLAHRYDESTKDTSISSYTTPFGNLNEPSAHIATHFRPTDIYPGEFAYLNQHNCGIMGGLFSSTLIGGGASLRMAALTNAARLTCDSYIRHTLTGNYREYHNGRYLSTERDIAIHQEERLGGIGKQAPVWMDEKPAKGGLQTIRPRIKEISGYFGNLTSKFCFRPDPNESDSRTQGNDSKEAGVYRETIDPSGQYRLSAAGMIAIERTGRIPVPVRKCFPTDKDHGISDDPEALTSFEHDETDGARRQLELFDRQAYDLKNQYARVDGQGTQNPDYYVPQEEDLSPLADKYDSQFTNSETVKLNKFDDRHAGIYIGEDGSIILRDAWGSEIVMLGGNITLSCAGNIMVLPGKSQLTIAGDDIVQKAQNSVDIHASKHDVRLSATRNMEILGGGDETQHSGGVIIESRGKGVGAWDGEEKGESAMASGITLRTNKQAIVIDGQYLIARSRKNTRILSGDKELDGEIGIGAKYIRSRAKMIISTTKNSGMFLGESSAALTGKSVLVEGHSSAALISGGKYPVPIMWEPVNVNLDLSNSTEDLAKEKKASIGFSYEELKKMIFGFRSSQECGTTKAWAIGGNGPFKMYEPAWIEVMTIYKTLKNNIQTEAYKEDAEWENGKPWPGKDAEDNAKYVQLMGNKPANLSADGYNNSRKAVQANSKIEEKDLKDYYLIRKQEEE